MGESPGGGGEREGSGWEDGKEKGVKEELELRFSSLAQDRLILRAPFGAKLSRIYILLRRR